MVSIFSFYFNHRPDNYSLHSSHIYCILIRPTDAFSSKSLMYFLCFHIAGPSSPNMALRNEIRPSRRVYYNWGCDNFIDNNQIFYTLIKYRIRCQLPGARQLLLPGYNDVFWLNCVYKINVEEDQFSCQVPMFPWLLSEHTEKHKVASTLQCPREFIDLSGTGRHLVPQEPLTLTSKTYDACLPGQLGQANSPWFPTPHCLPGLCNLPFSLEHKSFLLTSPYVSYYIYWLC